MLAQLHIENIAVISCADIDFSSGFSVMTGETGAGKSILIDSITILLGGRAPRDIIRRDCQKAVVSAVFEPLGKDVSAFLQEYGLDSDEGNVIIQRNISSDGKSSARINGRQVTVSVLKEIGHMLVNFHGQHENNNLLNAETHIRYLDSFAKNDKEKAEYFEIYNQVRALEDSLASLDMDEREKAYKTELLKYQLNEIESAALIPAGKDGEDEEAVLNREKNIAANRNRITGDVYKRQLYG